MKSIHTSDVGQCHINHLTSATFLPFLWKAWWDFRLRSLAKLFPHVGQECSELGALWRTGPCLSCLCALRASTEGNVQSQSGLGQGMLSSGEEGSSMSRFAPSSCSIFPDARLGLETRFLPWGLRPQFWSLANLTWCCRSSSSLRKLQLHLQHRKVLMSSVLPRCTDIRCWRSRIPVRNKTPQSLQACFRSLHLNRLCMLSCKIINNYNK